MKAEFLNCFTNCIRQDILFISGEILESLRAYAGEEIEPDEWNLQMTEDACG